MCAKKISGNDAIDAALRLDGDPESVRAFYEDWALDYDADVDSAEYAGPAIAGKLLRRHLEPGDASILDAGCGTGLVGVELRKQGYSRVDGFDLSESMARLAADTGCYREVRGAVDMQRADREYPADRYDALLSIGVFTLGHVPPRALRVLLKLVRPGGLLIVSTRSHYYAEGEFQPLVDELLATGSIELLQSLMDAPYNKDGDAHYWVFRREP